ncbi:MAG: hypothetical protein JWP65_2101 [Ramlibacter sp.]|uniref:DUF4148 domain-containing protein n=1 Tax=Ramlibacter sp. TaxID=1917967 RepID=UPI002603A831|nr:DUF4148 domain-containing protein [Ramlibacter sp.]MDB5751680.1 hypothetical protein [Ramlibacter sp.]
MNRTHATCLALAIAAAAGSALAETPTVETSPFVSTASRAQVRQELLRYRLAGINPWADDHDQLAQFRSSTTRAKVTNEFLASRNAVAAFSSEDSGSSYLARMHAPARSAATELARAQAE